MKKKQFEDSMNGRIKVVATEHRGGTFTTGHHKSAPIGMNSDFHNPAYQLSKEFGEALKNIAQFQPVKTLDPKTIECKPLTGIDHKRFLAAKLARKYFNWKLMRTFAFRARSGRISEKQCDFIIGLAKSIEAHIALGKKPDGA